MGGGDDVNSGEELEDIDELSSLSDSESGISITVLVAELFGFGAADPDSRPTGGDFLGRPRPLLGDSWVEIGSTGCFELSDAALDFGFLGALRGFGGEDGGCPDGGGTCSCSTDSSLDVLADV
ncbi:unnamed protein product [Clonostachys rosea f. rosea IK726]|uniref:Uncharacterized protein n=1 Tax=Clonostachys rosea f. rosea IK726 TaxID=1349383 RepID=A0ACA9UQD6_BIOOC|nr:unnamed protein product [Clonostachys rosea f. rosea IK726]